MDMEEKNIKEGMEPSKPENIQNSFVDDTNEIHDVNAEIDGQRKRGSPEKLTPVRNSVVIETKEKVNNGDDDTSIEIEVRRKRGRPAKLTPVQSTVTAADVVATGEKRGRGRPRGSRKDQVSTSIHGVVANTARGNFTPYMLTVNTGEDIVSKLISFSQWINNTIWIISATGTVSTVVLNRPTSFDGVLSYEGYYELLSLIGSVTSINGSRRSTLSVSLARPNGQVFGGSLAGCLIAASPIQMVIGYIKQSILSESKTRQTPEFTIPPVAATVAAAAAAANGHAAAMPVYVAAPAAEHNGNVKQSPNADHPETTDHGEQNVWQSLQQPVSDHQSAADAGVHPSA